MAWNVSHLSVLQAWINLLPVSLSVCMGQAILLTNCKSNFVNVTSGFSAVCFFYLPKFLDGHVFWMELTCQTSDCENGILTHYQYCTLWGWQSILTHTYPHKSPRKIKVAVINGWQPILLSAWCLLWWFASLSRVSHTWHWMSLLRSSVTKQGRTQNYQYCLFVSQVQWEASVHQAEWRARVEVDVACCRGSHVAAAGYHTRVRAERRVQLRVQERHKYVQQTRKVRIV